MDRFPTIEALAASSTEEVNVMWAGLGYYRRAAQILACAKVLVSEHGGRLPETSEELKKLPGIGRALVLCRTFLVVFSFMVYFSIF